MIYKDATVKLIKLPCKLEFKFFAESSDIS